MGDALAGTAAAVLGVDADEGRRVAARLRALSTAFPPAARWGLRGGAAALDAAARVLAGAPLDALDPPRREAVCALVDGRARHLVDALKLVLLLAAAEPAPPPAPLVRPDPPLDCVPAPDWPARATADAVVVGSGAGGAIAARELARAGLRVVVLEEGRRFTAAEFRAAAPVDRFVAMYRDGGATVALGDPPVLLPTGRGVGGTTLVNSGTCYRPPDRVLRHWRERYGVAADLAPPLDEVERTLGVAPQPLDVLGRNGELALAGAAALGWRAAPLRRNAPGCAGSCQCAVGCPTNAKNGVHLSVLPDACAAGAVIVTGARVDRVLVSRGRADGVAFGDREILAPLVVVAAGALETPRLLRRSGLARHPHVGRNLAVHPAIAVGGRFAEPVRSWVGVLQSVGIEELHDDGILIEATAGPPGMRSLAVPGTGRALRDELATADRVAVLGALVADRPVGRVGTRTVRYQVTPRDADRLRRAVVAMGRVLFAAGAQEVLTGLPRHPYARTPGALEEIVAATPARDLHLAAFHPTGTVRMGADPRTAPADPWGRLRGVRGVVVADASAVPSSPEVNPQLSIMALALAVARAAA